MTTLRRQLVVPTAVLAVFIVAALGYLAWDTAVESRALRRSTDEVRSASALAFALTQASHDDERLVLAVRGSAPGALEPPLAETNARETDIVARITARPMAPRAAAIWREYLRARGSLLGARDEIIQASWRRDGARLAVAYDRWEILGDRTAALLENFTALHLRQLDATVAELQVRRERVLGTAAVATLLGVLLAVGFAVSLARSVVRPLARMATAAKNISEGTASRVPGASRSDELGVLARSLNGMTQRLVSANERLAQAVRARDEFLSIASHELKTPLTPLQLRLDQLLKTAERDAEGPQARAALVRAADSLQRQVTRLAKLVGSLLDISRITSGKLTLEVQELSAAELLHELADRLHEELRAAGCSLAVEVREDVQFEGDRLRLEQVVSNLLVNAAKYAPGPLWLRSGVAGGDLEIEVEDAGPGIDPADHERIFDRFERAVGDGESVSGLGLGLYIAREIARAHGGDLTVASAPGRGARFTVRLPRGQEHAAARAERRSTANPV